MWPPRARAPRLRPALFFLDTAGLAVAVWLAHEIRFTVEHYDEKVTGLLENPGLLLWMAVTGWLLSAATELYEPELFHHRRETVLRTVVMILVWAVGVAFATYAVPAWSYGRGILVLTAVLWWPSLIAGRRFFASWLRTRHRARALIVGSREAVADVCRQLAEHPSAPWQPVDGSATPLAEIRDKVAEVEAELIVLAGRDLDRSTRELSALHFAGVPVVATVDLWAALDERLPLGALSPELFHHQPGLGAVHWHPLHRLTNLADIGVAAVLFVITAPLLLLAMAAVAVFDGRPVLYRQQRLGQFGRPFEILKLRTMVRDAERDGPVFAAENDSRVTRLGGLLRRLRIDELPQLLNVLRGEMALVGPRPERPELAAELAEEIPFYTFRLAVRPGLTGWAQVNAPYARDASGHQIKLEYDLYFVREPSFQLYFLTILRTLNVMLVGSRRRRPPDSSLEEGLESPRDPS